VLFGLRRTAGGLAALAAVVAAAAAGYALSRSSAYVTIRLLGPAVTIAGAVLTAAAATIHFSINRTRRALS
jgi:hypothetical protein